MMANAEWFSARQQLAPVHECGDAGIPQLRAEVQRKTLLRARAADEHALLAVTTCISKDSGYEASVLLVVQREYQQATVQVSSIS